MTTTTSAPWRFSLFRWLPPAAITLALLLASCRSDNDPAPGVIVPPTLPPGSTAATDPASSPDPTTDTIVGMSLEDKVGQMLMFGFEGQAYNDALDVLVRDWHVGGIAFLGSNIAGPRPLAELTADLQAASIEATEQGLLLSIDQEGGEVLRLTGPFFTEFPAAETVGAAGDPDSTRRLAAAIAAEMKAVGLNMDLAPVLDVAGDPPSPPIGSRSFGSDPDLVSSMGAAFINGLHDGGVISTAKHFPGHGSAPADSHLELPIDDRPASVLRSVDIAPYRAAIDVGVDVIMTAHVAYPELDTGAGPATLSRPIVTGILRGELGYNGVIATDSMTMRAITDAYGAGEASVLAVQAGADLVVVSGPFSTEEVIRDTLIAAVREGRIPEARIDQSVTRILRLKQKYAVAQVPTYQPDVVGAAEHQQIVDEILAAGE